MTGRLFLSVISLIFSGLFLSFTTSSPHDTASVDTDIEVFKDLIVAVNSACDTVVRVPDELNDLVEGYYADVVIPESMATAVLSYLSDVYCEHDYYETGSWLPREKGRIYTPRRGEIPKYDISDFHIPVNGSLTSGYGYRPRFQRIHHGIDISLSIGDTVMCVLPGIVTKTGYERGGYGRYVVVSHADGLETLYGHLQRALVVPGQRITAREPIGLGGVTGNATGAHLHFETRYRGMSFDPLTRFDLHLR